MNVLRFRCSSAERLAQVLAGDPAVPYRAHRDRIGHTAFDHWAVERSARLLCGATGAFEVSKGALGWKALPWDSELLGFNAARIDVLAVSGGYTEARETASLLIASAVEECAASDVQHVVARIDASSLAHSHALAGNGFELIDGIQTFALKRTEARPSGAGSPQSLPPATKEPPRPAGLWFKGAPPDTRIASAADAGMIADIARSSFVHDRFHNDVTVGTDAANRLHEAWARNSVSGEAADAVLLATTEDAVDAFVTVKLDLGSAAALGLRFATIPLVATGLVVRGKGAARRATDAALAWCWSQNADVVEVGTQISNVPATRLYQAAGFRTTAISLTYRKWID